MPNNPFKPSRQFPLPLSPEPEEKPGLRSRASKKIPLLFRKEVPEIPSTTYATFGVYKYPAKFIPQVIAYVLREYAQPGMKIFDPFAGYGTVGVVCRIYGCDYELWDLNPILETIHSCATARYFNFEWREFLEEMKNFPEQFYPRWSNLDYWHPPEFIPLLSRSWAYVHSLEKRYKRFFLIPLLKTTRYFSYSDEKVHKLYRSKYSRKKIRQLLDSDWEEIFYRMLERELIQFLKKLWEYQQLTPQKVKFKIKAGIDTLKEDLSEPVDILITSPPYLQAQEYLRSTKLELFWLGYEEEKIRQLSKLEIPYRKVEKMEIFSEKYFKLRKKIKEENLLQLYDNYFNSILSVLSRLSKKVENRLAIFVGPAKIRELAVEIDDIIAEHLSYLGWQHELTLIDKIVARVMFESKINPASKREDSRIKTEHLIILRRK